MLEKSKIFTKELCDENYIPTGKYKKFSNFEDALIYCQSINFPCVIKADGLAAGKGVLILDDLQEANPGNSTNLQIGEWVIALQNLSSRKKNLFLKE